MNGIKEAYETGRGLLTIRAKVVVETEERTDRERLIVTEMPYQVNKLTLIEKIAELIREDRVKGISDLRDEVPHRIAPRGAGGDRVEAR